MSQTIIYCLLTALSAFAWGMLFQEKMTKRYNDRRQERRIIVDAPFSPEQSEVIVKILADLNEAVQQSMN